MRASSPQVRVREATELDLRAICDVDPLLNADMHRRQFVLRSVSAQECLVAQDDAGRLVGYVILNYTFFHQGFIPLIVVATEFRRQGVGFALLGEAEARCQRPKLFASCNASNSAARSLLERRGFTSSGVVSNLDPGDDEHFYFKRANEA